ncbi:MAG: LacI family DNA-binding transcriptional regulator [Chloroflexota bacterium]
MSVKRVTSQDVADLAGVSRTTVSLVLNNVESIRISPSTRQKVFDAADQLGYVPDAAAQALASRRAQIVGLILTRNPHHIASDVFLNKILDGLLEVTHENNVRLMFDIVEPEHQREAYLQMVRSKRIDGILLSGPRFDDEALRVLEEDGFPAVLMGQLPETGFCSVDVDNCAAARKAVAHLIRLGHQRIACITNAPGFYTAAADRLLGYRRALSAAGLDFEPELVRYGEFDIESGYLQMMHLLQSRAKFSAAFIASDTLALGAKAALREAGLHVPKDVALVGFDDLPFAQYLDPPLTTIHLPASEIAREACQILMRLLEGDEPKDRQVILDTHLVIRQSCGSVQLLSK